MNGMRIDCIADTSAVIGLLRRNPLVIAAMRGKSYAITFVTEAELHLGVLRANDPSAAAQDLEEVLHRKLAFKSTASTPRIYADICHRLEKGGKRIPSNDMWIAALAMEKGLPLAARDEHFARVEGLRLIPV